APVPQPLLGILHPGAHFFGNLLHQFFPTRLLGRWLRGLPLLPLQSLQPLPDTCSWQAEPDLGIKAALVLDNATTGVIHAAAPTPTTATTSASCRDLLCPRFGHRLPLHHWVDFVDGRLGRRLERVPPHHCFGQGLEPERPPE